MLRHNKQGATVFNQILYLLNAHRLAIMTIILMSPFSHFVFTMNGNNLYTSVIVSCHATKFMATNFNIIYGFECFLVNGWEKRLFNVKLSSINPFMGEWMKLETKQM